MSTKKGGGWQGIYSSNIEGFVNETLQKALKKNQTRLLWFILYLNYCFNFIEGFIKSIQK